MTALHGSCCASSQSSDVRTAHLKCEQTLTEALELSEGEPDTIYHGFIPEH